MIALSSPAALPTFRRSLREDERGAVMLMGVFFATFLVGSLWYLFGIGQAIFFRERAQEIADSAALSSAIIHAQGMNFIAALNLIQFALVIGHMIMAIIWVVLLIFAVIAGAPDLARVEA